MQSIITKLKDILNSQAALIEKCATCQLEMDEKGYTKEAERLSEVGGIISGTTDDIKNLISEYEMALNREKAG